MDDLISRAEAIDEIKAVFEWHDTVTEDRIIQHLSMLPSAQPTGTNTVQVDDCISREAAIDGSSGT